MFVAVNVPSFPCSAIFQYPPVDWQRSAPVVCHAIVLDPPAFTVSGVAENWTVNGVEVGVAVGAGVGLGVGVGVGVGDGVGIGVGVAVGTGVGVGALVGTGVGVGTGVIVGW